MNRIVLIGNGFDLAHNLPTRYENFIDWYWDERINELKSYSSNVYKDSLCDLKLTNSQRWHIYLSKLPNDIKDKPGKVVINYIGENNDFFVNNPKKLFENICKSVETRGWVDIENEYYKLLKETALMHFSIRQTKELNDQLQYVEDLLVKYLTS